MINENWGDCEYCKYEDLRITEYPCKECGFFDRDDNEIVHWQEKDIA